MKKALVGFLAGAMLLIPSVGAAASYFKVGQNIETNSGVSTAGDLYVAAAGVVLSADVQGDALSAGGNVLISGDVEGDVMVAGGNINLTGKVGESLRAVGGNIIVGGEVGRDVVIGGGQVSLVGEGVRGDAMIGAGQLTIEAPIAGRLRAQAGEVVINGVISGDVNITAEKIVIGEKAVISGNFEYTSRQEAEMKEGAVVRGTVNYHPLAEARATDGKVWGWKWMLALAGGWLLIKFLVVLITALILTALASKFSVMVAEQAGENMGWELGRGFVVLVVVPVAAVILLISIVGFLLGILTGLAYAIIMITASVFSGVVLGSWLFKKLQKKGAYQVNWKTTLSGVVVMYLLALIPVVGWVISLLVILVTLGALTKVGYKQIKTD